MMTCAAQPFMASFSAEVNRERLLYELLVDVKLPCQCEDGKKSQSFCCSCDQMDKAIVANVPI